MSQFLRFTLSRRSREGDYRHGHKLARIVYALMTKGEAYEAKGTKELEEKARAARLRSLEASAESLGFQLVKNPSTNHQIRERRLILLKAHNNSRESDDLVKTTVSNF
jgi:LmbE family N-acetylglucosaminyl deacetylase